ncbi:MAG: hypothetical protein IH820_09015 [Bacteroidetes bacterium]|nr:hypothetical protein [Bacteroidota bacterium]
MRYLFTSERRDYSDYASGHVFMGRPGHPAFPLRLASELFQRCLAVRRAEGLSGPCVLYDPFCGGAYLLSTLAYLHWHEIDQVIGSDIDEEALALAARNLALAARNLALAARNLALLRLEGLDRRIEDLAAMRAAYGKASHAAALERANVLRQRLVALNETHRVAAHLFCADATDGQALRNQLKPAHRRGPHRRALWPAGYVAGGCRRSRAASARGAQASPGARRRRGAGLG